MRSAAKLLCLVSGWAFTAPAGANLLVEMSYQEKMASSDIVIVGTVTASVPGQPEKYDAAATVFTLATLKGTPQAQHIVLTQDRIPEDDPRCCQVGASYVMFLHRAADGSLRSVNGRFGMIRIGPANNDPKIEVIREGEDKPRQ